jgi:hypothetical protein
MYADFAFYLNDFHGTLGEETFSRLSIIAKAHIDRITSNKAVTATGNDLLAVKLAFCAVVDELDKQEQGGIIASESNDGISRSYVTGSIVKSSTQRINAAANVFLSSTNLLFVGV